MCVCVSFNLLSVELGSIFSLVYILRKTKISERYESVRKTRRKKNIQTHTHITILTQTHTHTLKWNWDNVNKITNKTWMFHIRTVQPQLQLYTHSIIVDRYWPLSNVIRNRRVNTKKNLIHLYKSNQFG